MQITLAPIPFYWSKNQVEAFYHQAEKWPVERICLGETICPKRREMRLQDWLDIGKDLKIKGKTVVLSTLALVQAESDIKTLTSFCEQDAFDIEANDLAAVEICQKLGRTFSAGPYLNIYNSATLNLLYQDGLRRWTPPVELGKDTIADILNAMTRDSLPICTELMVHGYLPLALSARCFTARALKKPKDHCERICLDYPQGMSVKTAEQQRLFTLNGIQTLSGQAMDLRHQRPDILQLGINNLRISPSQPDMSHIIDAFSKDSGHSVEDIDQSEYCNGYWFGDAGMAKYD